jgi:4'-phosphopantetheinyl transferase
MPADFERPTDPSGIEIVVLRPAISAAGARAAQPLLTAKESERAARYVRDPDRFRYVQVCARRRLLLAARLGVPAKTVALVRGPRGKPALAPGATVDLRFNTSHSEDLSAFACAIGREIGIDIEAVRPAHDLGKVAARFLSGAEREAYARLEHEDRLLAFYQAWTRKEAFAKALGEGMNFPLQDLDVSFGPGEPARILRVGDTPGACSGWRLWSFAPAPGFVGAVVVADAARPGPRARGDDS